MKHLAPIASLISEYQQALDSVLGHKPTPADLERLRTAERELAKAAYILLPRLLNLRDACEKLIKGEKQRQADADILTSKVVAINRLLSDLDASEEWNFQEVSGFSVAME